jgi:glycosyltransferase involved in cell wall biosynthesis
MPTVSVIIPTYNRADTIVRAVRSVLSQTYNDWELIIVDDGSTDNTIEKIRDIDPRLKIITQKNQGASVARNVGIQASRGKYIAMLDSDDGWYPNYLEACVTFLESHPEEDVVQTEYVWNRGKLPYEVLPITEITQLFVPLAHKIGSKVLDLPPGETDHYLRIYKERIPIEDWGKNLVDMNIIPSGVHYRGNIFDYWRWGYLMTLWSTVITRRSFDSIGGFNPLYKHANDFYFLIKLCRAYPVNLLPFPGAIKHQTRDDGLSTSEEHLASGKNTLKFELSYLEQFENLFWKINPNDPELQFLRAQRQFSVGQAALWESNKRVALQYTEEALRSNPNFLRAKIVRGFLKYIPHIQIARRAYALLTFFDHVYRKYFRG